MNELKRSCEDTRNMSNEIVIFSFARHSVRQLLKNELKIMP
jgi:hypothetical protein